MHLVRCSLSITNSSNGNITWVAPQLLGGCAAQDIDPCSMMYWSTVVRLHYIMIGHERGTNTATVMVWYSAAKGQCNGTFAAVLSLDF
jgi:hypothetical protein